MLYYLMSRFNYNTSHYEVVKYFYHQGKNKQYQNMYQ
jgi:hypothetical protein